MLEFPSPAALIAMLSGMTYAAACRLAEVMSMSGEKRSRETTAEPDVAVPAVPLSVTVKVVPLVTVAEKTPFIEVPAVPVNPSSCT